MLLFRNMRNVSLLKHFLILLWCHLFVPTMGRLFALLVCAVVGAAKRLPVGLVPEQRLVATMRLDVVDHRGHGRSQAQLSTEQDGRAGRHVTDGRIGRGAQAVDAKRVAVQMAGTGLLPGIAVAALGAARLIGAP